VSSPAAGVGLSWTGRPRKAQSAATGRTNTRPRLATRRSKGARRMTATRAITYIARRLSGGQGLALAVCGREKPAKRPRALRLRFRTMPAIPKSCPNERIAYARLTSRCSGEYDAGSSSTHVSSRDRLSPCGTGAVSFSGAWFSACMSALVARPSTVSNSLTASRTLPSRPAQSPAGHFSAGRETMKAPDATSRRQPYVPVLDSVSSSSSWPSEERLPGVARNAN
jgi:hypothetical protein